MAVALVLGILVVAVGIWVFLRQRRAEDERAAASVAQSVLVHLRLSDEAFGTADEVARLQDLEIELENAIADARVGIVDGNEIGEGEYVIFVFGPDADRLFDVLEPLLRASPLSRDGFAFIRYGLHEDPNAREIRIDL